MQGLFDNQPLRTKQHAGGARRMRRKRARGVCGRKGGTRGRGTGSRRPTTERGNGNSTEVAPRCVTTRGRGNPLREKETAMSNATATRKPRQRRSHERSVKVLVAPAAG